MQWEWRLIVATPPCHAIPKPSHLCCQMEKQTWRASFDNITAGTGSLGVSERGHRFSYPGPIWEAQQGKWPTSFMDPRLPPPSSTSISTSISHASGSILGLWDCIWLPRMLFIHKHTLKYTHTHSHTHMLTLTLTHAHTHTREWTSPTIDFHIVVQTQLPLSKRWYLNVPLGSYYFSLLIFNGDISD